MVSNIKNNEVMKQIQRATNLNNYVDEIPTKLAKEVQVIINATPLVSPDVLVNNSGVGTTTLLTVSTDANIDTYLTFATINCEDATSSATDNYLKFTDSRGSNGFIGAGTPSSNGISNNFVSFNPPIRLQKGSIIQTVINAQVGRASAGWFLLNNGIYETINNG